jgi:KaiC/GvpD/RAD55 family RecA-like ATPase
VTLALNQAIGTGGKFLPYRAPRKFRTLYVEGELPGQDFQTRVRSMIGQELPDNFHFMCFEDQGDDYRPPLGSAAGRLLVEQAIQDVGAEVVFFDSISSLANLLANEEESWLELSQWLMRLRKMRLAVFYLQHDGKTGMQRGHSKHEDIIDRSAWLRWDNGYEGQDGLKCIMGFDKNRPGPLGRYQKLMIELNPVTNLWTYAEARAEQGQLNKGGRPVDGSKAAKVDYILKLRTENMNWSQITCMVNKKFGSNHDRKIITRWYEEHQVDEGLQLSLKPEQRINGKAIEDML